MPNYKILSFLILAFSPSLLNAAELQEVKSFSCNYNLSSTANSNRAEFAPKANSKEEISLKFEVVDAENAKGRMVENAKDQDVQVISGDGIITFLSKDDAGKVLVTSIYGQKDGMGRYFSSYSKHAETPANATSSQWYGVCVGSYSGI